MALQTITNRDPYSITASASGGRNTVIYDSLGVPNWMVAIPYFELDWIGPDLGTGPHPAFVVNGEVKPEIWIGQYQATKTQLSVASIPGASIYLASYRKAVTACRKKGPGWHLMTNSEWSAVTLWCLWHGYQPRGNTNQGRSHENPFEIGRRLLLTEDICLTGSGPVAWRHDGSPFGIADLVGNYDEWVDGIKQVDGVIHLAEHWRQPENEWMNTSSFPTEYGQLGAGDDPLEAFSTPFNEVMQSENYIALPSLTKLRLAQALIDPDASVLRNEGRGQLSLIDGTGYCYRGGNSSSQENAGLAAGAFMSSGTRSVRVAYIP